MECERVIIKTEEIMLPDRLETNIEEVGGPWTGLMENVKPEVDTTVHTEPAVSPENYVAQRAAECLQFIEVGLPLRCRLCALPGDNMVNIFDLGEKNESIISKIQRCLPILVKKTDPLPKQVCQSCLVNLEFCYQFHRTVIDAEAQLLFLQRPMQRKENGLSFPLCDNSIKGRCKQNSNNETVSNKRRNPLGRVKNANMPVRSKSTLADLKPCSVVLYIDKTLEKNNSDKGAITRGSKDTNASNFGQTAAPISAQQSACNLKVPENPLRTSSKLQSQIRDADQAKPAGTHERDKGEGKFYTCDLCPNNKILYSKREQIRHKNTHNGRGRHSCLYCGKKFMWPSRRAAHQRTHTGERPFKCAECHKEFTIKQSLRRHIAAHHVHNGKRPFKCAECGKDFTMRNKLKQHQVVHTGEKKNYPCSLCDKSFKSSFSRIHHMLSHLADGQSQCDYCKVYFSKKSLLKNHMRFCKVRYPLPNELRREIQVSSEKEVARVGRQMLSNNKYGIARFITPDLYTPLPH